MKAGDLRHPITLMAPTDTVNAAGRPVKTWRDQVTVYASKADVSGREFYEAQAYHAEDTVTWTLRWRDDVTPEWRLRHGNGEESQIYEIIEVNHLGYRYDFMRLKTRMIRGEKH